MQITKIVIHSNMYLFMYIQRKKSIQSSFQPAPSLLALDKKVIANIFLLNRVYANRLAATYFSRTIYSSNWSQLEITLQSQFEKILNEAFVSHYLQLITNPSLQSCKRFHVSMLIYLMLTFYAHIYHLLCLNGHFSTS
jgi:hypothetical protein